MLAFGKRQRNESRQPKPSNQLSLSFGWMERRITWGNGTAQSDKATEVKGKKLVKHFSALFHTQKKNLSNEKENLSGNFLHFRQQLFWSVVICPSLSLSKYIFSRMLLVFFRTSKNVRSDCGFPENKDGKKVPLPTNERTMDQ